MRKLMILSLLFFAIIISGHGRAIELAPAFGAVDESDDNLKPVIGLKSVLGAYSASLWYWGRKFGPVRESSFLVTGSKYFHPFRWKPVRTEVGLAGLSETTSLTYTELKNENASETFLNLGVYFGVSSSMQMGLVDLSVSWQSALFPAGLSGGIFLATGRKQVLSLSAGVDL